MAVFDRSEWVSRGENWKDVPKSVRKVCVNDLAIPDIIASQILPDAAISIQALLEFSLPRPSPTPSILPETSLFFSKYKPAVVEALTITRVRHLDMPPVKVIRRLAHDLGSDLGRITKLSNQGLRLQTRNHLQRGSSRYSAKIQHKRISVYGTDNPPSSRLASASLVVDFTVVAWSSSALPPK
ncbi:hypothetical protein C8R46DRAFT_1250914 [Mycena filopes]|nr:hypothetical protein C8R46DRAFT_1250914 [Mycena filopes]